MEAIAPSRTRVVSSIQPRFAARTKKKPMPSAVTAPPAIAKPRAPMRSHSRARSPIVLAGGATGATGAAAAWVVCGAAGAACVGVEAGVGGAFRGGGGGQYA